MPDFNATLLREKFTMTDAMPVDIRDAAPVIALSNRFTLPLRGETGPGEVFVVRAQNMHTCVRLGAQIAKAFYEGGPLLERPDTFDWQGMYDEVIKGYESSWNDFRWAAVYNKGRVVFEAGEAQRHMFLDIIEQCDARNKGDYEKAVDVATDAFKQAGRLVTIKHHSNVALVVNITGEEEGKCGVIVRGPSRTTTFNLTARKKAERGVKVSGCLTAAAAFLEGIQLAFFIGMTKQKIRYEILAQNASEARQAEDAGHKLARLNGAVQQFETMYDVNYRPDRPVFSKLIDDAEEYAIKVLRGEIEVRARSGDSDWLT